MNAEQFAVLWFLGCFFLFLSMLAGLVKKIKIKLKICKDCKHWEDGTVMSPLNPKGFGWCKPMTPAYPMKNGLFVPKGGVMIGENFGCIHFEQKEPEYNIPS